MARTPYALPGLLALLGALAAPAPSSSEARDPALALLQQRCIECHGPERPKGDVRLDDLAGFGGFAAQAERWELVLDMLDSGQMPPPTREQPSAEERALLSAWIRAQLGEADPHAGRGPRLHPEYGNELDHARLFDGSLDEVGWSPSRLWKRSPHQFDSLVLRGLGVGQGRHGRPHQDLGKLKQPFTLEERAGLRDYAALTFADSATLATLLRNAEVLADKLTGGAMLERRERLHGPIPEDELPRDRNGNPQRPRFPRTPDAFRAIIESEEPPSDHALEEAARHMYALVVEREPALEQVERYRALMRECMQESNPAEGLRVGLIAIAVSPDAIYRAELGQGPVDEHGRQRLGATDLAYALAYALTDEPPDAALLEAAQDGRLATRADVEREAARLWDDPDVAKPRVLRFFQEYFGYAAAPGVFKDESRYGGDYRGVAEKLVRDADVLVLHHVERDLDVLEELLTTREYFVAHDGDNSAMRVQSEELRAFYEYFREHLWENFPYQTPELHADYARSISRQFAHPNGNVVKGWMRHLTRCEENGVRPVPMQNGRDYLLAYNLRGETFDYPYTQPFALDPERRAGLLMHPAWLLAHSLNAQNDPVRRGKWVRERLLADTVPELPLDVDASIPEEPEQTLRQRFAVTRAEECWRCHVQMNPLGMTFEAFDDFGRTRELERLLAPRRTAPVDAHGELVGTRDANLDGPVEDPVELVERLARSERVRQSFVRHAFRYWMGRNEMPSDSRALRDADAAYVENCGSFRALVLSLLTSDSFLYRKPLEEHL